MSQMLLDFGDDQNGRGRPGKDHDVEHRLFFALCPPDAIEQQAASIAHDYRRAFSLSGEPRLTTLHVSIIWVGDYPKLPEDVVFAAQQAGSTVESAPIAMTFDQIMRFPQARALVLCGEGGRKPLTRLRVQLGVSMHNAGFPHNIGGNFKPHMTLLYDRKTVPPTSLDTPVSWTASEFLLVHSLLGKTEHRIIDRWPLLG
ncbi:MULTISPECIES: 2'-5' RNA ligase family protein [Rhizobium]|uniref:2'-5' RNA ligase n=1 Tax=Rhizobium laguerreae TaxID=1076926 RepID=A0A6N9ZG25_9HYPH|nr:MULTISPECIES: 2'-5' RNA ligase family protein [Rhizobium]NEH92452.1 2'-5' RNA ligase [Rhizobium laguerreae]NKK65966.1 2'-5' RNA ligase [Rhizobium leguminosarum bv. viciae]NKL08063.1 2'-5' RNA ligase [Rhizobium leguminosarum bv. viciae]NKL85015.1 2'-5' RNA ligase [Rhizobium leguminosarum bv. viciae]NKL90365.1 2'-5' RNA ligase [Rhizobium leguminosarum bv. viciae]